MNLIFFCWVRHVLMLALFFSIIWIKIPDRYQIVRVWRIRLMINHLVVPVDLESSPKDRSCLSTVYTLRLYSLYYTLSNKHCLMILPLFVAICEIWLSGLIYGVYLVLSLKPSATCFSRNWSVVPYLMCFALNLFHNNLIWLQGWVCATLPLRAELIVISFVSYVTSIL